MTLNEGQGQWINTRWIIMSEAVAVPNLMMMTLIVSEESLARDRHTHTHTHRDSVLVTGYLPESLLCKHKKGIEIQ